MILCLNKDEKTPSLQPSGLWLFCMYFGESAVPEKGCSMAVSTAEHKFNDVLKDKYRGSIYTSDI